MVLNMSCEQTNSLIENSGCENSPDEELQMVFSNVYQQDFKQTDLANGSANYNLCMVRKKRRNGSAVKFVTQIIY